MLMRNEHKKFMDAAIPYVQDQLLCGARRAVYSACDGDADPIKTKAILDELLTEETKESALGSYQGYKVKSDHQD
jgi:hypothetical protein